MSEMSAGSVTPANWPQKKKSRSLVAVVQMEKAKNTQQTVNEH